MEIGYDKQPALNLPLRTYPLTPWALSAFCPSNVSLLYGLKTCFPLPAMICLFGNEPRTNESSKASTFCHYPDRTRDPACTDDHLDIEPDNAKTVTRTDQGSFSNAEILINS